MSDDKSEWLRSLEAIAFTPTVTENRDAGYREFVTADRPTITRHCDGYALLLDMETRQPIGVRWPMERRPETRREVRDRWEILRRLRDGDSIAFSEDGDSAWFIGGDRAEVGDAIIGLRKDGYIKRVVDDEDNYRGMSERDVITDRGRRALAEKERRHE